MADARVGDVRAMTGKVDTSLDSVNVARRVLVDTCANEVTRPQNTDWWKDIMVARETRKTCHPEVGRWSDNPRSHDT
eukprot:12886839-Prorocentrum_lima.AAC.1